MYRKVCANRHILPVPKHFVVSRVLLWPGSFFTLFFEGQMKKDVHNKLDKFVLKKRLLLFGQESFIFINLKLMSDDRVQALRCTIQSTPVVAVAVNQAVRRVSLKMRTRRKKRGRVGKAVVKKVKVKAKKKVNQKVRMKQCKM